MMPAGVHELASGLPKQISIGTTKAFKDGRAFHYTMKFIEGANDKGVHVCPSITETGRDGEQMFTLFAEGYWHACEGKNLQMQRTCLRSVKPASVPQQISGMPIGTLGK